MNKEILKREISNAFNDVLYTLIEPNRHRLPTIQEYEDVVLKYLESERCAKNELAIELLKPNLKDKPDWATCYAMDNDGVWCWFEKKPRLDSTGIWRNGGKYQVVNLFNPENTLEFIGNENEKTTNKSKLNEMCTYELITHLNKSYKIKNISQTDCNRDTFRRGIETFLSNELKCEAQLPLSKDLNKCAAITLAIESLIDSCWPDINKLYSTGSYEHYFGRFMQFFEKINNGEDYD